MRKSEAQKCPVCLVGRLSLSNEILSGCCCDCWDKPASMKGVRRILNAQGNGETFHRSPSGYYYFDGGRTAWWPLTSIYVYQIQSLTLYQVAKDRNDLAAEELQGTGEYW